MPSDAGSYGIVFSKVIRFFISESYVYQVGKDSYPLDRWSARSMASRNNEYMVGGTGFEPVTSSL